MYIKYINYQGGMLMHTQKTKPTPKLTCRTISNTPQIGAVGDRSHVLTN